MGIYGNGVIIDAMHFDMADINNDTNEALSDWLIQVSSKYLHIFVPNNSEKELEWLSNSGIVCFYCSLNIFKLMY